MPINEQTLEVVKAWYALFCVLVDGYAEGDMTHPTFVDKIFALRRELADRMPEVEAEFRKRRN